MSNVSERQRETYLCCLVTQTGRTEQLARVWMARNIHVWLRAMQIGGPCKMGLDNPVQAVPYSDGCSAYMWMENMHQIGGWVNIQQVNKVKNALVLWKRPNVLAWKWKSVNLCHIWLFPADSVTPPSFTSSVRTEPSLEHVCLTHELRVPLVPSWWTRC